MFSLSFFLFFLPLIHIRARYIRSSECQGLTGSLGNIYFVTRRHGSPHPVLRFHHALSQANSTLGPQQPTCPRSRLRMIFIGFHPYTILAGGVSWGSEHVRVHTQVFMRRRGSSGPPVSNSTESSYEQLTGWCLGFFSP